MGFQLHSHPGFPFPRAIPIHWRNSDPFPTFWLFPSLEQGLEDWDFRCAPIILEAPEFPFSLELQWEFLLFPAFPTGIAASFPLFPPASLASIPWICSPISCNSRIPLLSQCREMAGKGNFSLDFFFFPWNVLSIPACLFVCFPSFYSRACFHRHSWDLKKRKRNIPAQSLPGLIPMDPLQLWIFQDFLISCLCQVGFEGI